MEGPCLRPRAGAQGQWPRSRGDPRAGAEGSGRLAQGRWLPAAGQKAPGAGGDAGSGGGWKAASQEKLMSSSSLVSASAFMSEPAPPSPGSTLPPTPLPADHSPRPFAPAPFQPVPSPLHRPPPTASPGPSLSRVPWGRGLILHPQPKSPHGHGGGTEGAAFHLLLWKLPSAQPPHPRGRGSYPLWAAHSCPSEPRSSPSPQIPLGDVGDREMGAGEGGGRNTANVASGVTLWPTRPPRSILAPPTHFSSLGRATPSRHTRVGF